MGVEQVTGSEVSPPEVIAAKALVKSRQRMTDHGEVFTPDWLVEAMLDLVKGETERIESRFLEPACGSGNFLAPVLLRKLVAVRVSKGRRDLRRNTTTLLACFFFIGNGLLQEKVKSDGSRLIVNLRTLLNLIA